MLRCGHEDSCSCAAFRTGLSIGKPIRNSLTRGRKVQFGPVQISATGNLRIPCLHFGLGEDWFGTTSAQAETFPKPEPEKRSTTNRHGSNKNPQPEAATSHKLERLRLSPTSRANSCLKCLKSCYVSNRALICTPQQEFGVLRRTFWSACPFLAICSPSAPGTARHRGSREDLFWWRSRGCTSDFVVVLGAETVSPGSIPSRKPLRCLGIPKRCGASLQCASFPTEPLYTT